MKKLIAGIVAACLAAVANAAMATTYVYGGSQYTTSSAPYTPAMAITGQFITSDPLLANLVHAPIGSEAMSWWFSDGMQTFTSENSRLWAGDPANFAVSTDGTGAITSFHIVLQGPAGTPAVGQPVSKIVIDSAGLQAAHGVPCTAVANGACSSIGATQAGSSTVQSFTLAPAVTTYTYTGVPYTSASAQYSTAMKITGQVVTPAPLAANSTNGIGAVTSWTFNDGVQTFTQRDSQVFGGAGEYFMVNTDESGAVTAFSIALQNPTGTTSVGQSVNAMQIQTPGAGQQAAHDVACTAVNNGACAQVAVVQAQTKAVGAFAITATPPPVATTVGAMLVTTTSATLVGIVNPNSAATAASFDYGTTTSYGSNVPATPTVPAGNADTQVCATASGLTCGTAYHFRIEAGNSVGNAAPGKDAIFATAPCPAQPPTATTGPATAITATSATLNGTVNDNGAATSASFDYGTTTNYGNNVSANPTPIFAGSGNSPITQIVQGLACNTTYHFRVRAGNSAGNAVPGNDQTFTTSACVGAAAPAPASSRLSLGLLALLLALACRFSQRRI